MVISPDYFFFFKFLLNISLTIWGLLPFQIIFCLFLWRVTVVFWWGLQWISRLLWQDSLFDNVGGHSNPWTRETAMVSVAFRLNRIWTLRQAPRHTWERLFSFHVRTWGAVLNWGRKTHTKVCGTVSWTWAWSAYRGGRQPSSSDSCRLPMWCHQHQGFGFPSMVDSSWPLSQNEPVPSSVTSRVFVTAARHSEAGVFLANTVSLQFAVECFHFSCLGLLLPLLN